MVYYIYIAFIYISNENDKDNDERTYDTQMDIKNFEQKDLNFIFLLMISIIGSPKKTHLKSKLLSV